MESSLTEITVKTCDCYSAYIDSVVKLTIDDLKKIKFMDFETSCYRLFSNIMVKCCFNCLKEKFLKMNITPVEDSLWFETPGDGKNIKVTYSSRLGEFLCNKIKISDICCHCQNLIIKHCFLASVFQMAWNEK